MIFLQWILLATFLKTSFSGKKKLNFLKDTGVSEKLEEFNYAML